MKSCVYGRGGGGGEGGGYFEDVSRKESDFVIRNEKTFHITKN